MIVCSCHGISDREVRRAARDSQTGSGALLRGCKAGQSCGGCSGTIQGILAEERARREVDARVMHLARPNLPV